MQRWTRTVSPTGKSSPSTTPSTTPSTRPDHPAPIGTMFQGWEFLDIFPYTLESLTVSLEGRKSEKNLLAGLN
jgi:hypothetical protein